MECELGDILFIASFILDGKKYLEKITINSIKRDHARKTVSWRIDGEQLYLLSGFPNFEGVFGIVPPGRKYHIPNESGCLGSYGLLYAPAGFAFTSATKLDSFLAGKSHLKREGLDLLLTRIADWSLPSSPICYSSRYCRASFFCIPHPCRNFQGASSIFDFAHKYLTLGIGEPTIMTGCRHNSQARKFIRELSNPARKTGFGGFAEDFLAFSTEYNRYPPFDGTQGDENGGTDYECPVRGGGIGIIYTTIEARRGID